MTSITRYKTAKGTRWRVRYRKPDRSQTDKRGFLTKREAELFAATVEVSKAAGSYIDPALGHATIRQLGLMWLDGKRVLKPSSYAPLDSSWRIHVEPLWGDREVASIMQSEVQRWVTALASRRSASVTLRAHGVLAGILDTAVADHRLQRNPARGVDLPRKGLGRRIYLTHAQLTLLAEESAHPAIVYLLGYTGLRWGEMIALRVRHVDRMRHRVRVEENAVQVGSTIHVGTPKSWERRTVAFPKFIDTMLEPYLKDKGPDTLVFGHMKSPDSRSGWFVNAVHRLQADDNHFPMLTPHGLRHVAAGLAVQAGANVKALSRMLGHKSAAMTLDEYADLFADDLDDVAEKLDAARRAHTLPTVARARQVATGTDEGQSGP